MKNIRVAVIGAGPAGIYAADILTKGHEGASVDIIERLPAPYGLVRYGVAPDHPRIKEIIKALGRAVDQDRVRLLCNVDFGTDLSLQDLTDHYDAVIFATGAMRDRALDIPGIDLDGSYGAADFVSWYDGHPDVGREWPLTAREVAVIGAGNVALDVSRILAKTADEQLVTEIPQNVYDGLKANQATDVHVFARRGPAQLKFSPLELRELSHSPNVDVIVHPEGWDMGGATQNQTRQQKMIVDHLLKKLDEEPTDAIHRIHLHFCEAPVEVLGADGHVVGLRTERTKLDDEGRAHLTGEITDWPVQAVYRAVGYLSSPLPEVPFDEVEGVIPNEAGRVLDGERTPIPQLYTTGWVKRGPVGLIGHTKSDASETIACLVEDADSLPTPAKAETDVLDTLRERGVNYLTLDGWHLLDSFEKSLGEAVGRERIKVVPRDEMIARSQAIAEQQA